MTDPNIRPDSPPPATDLPPLQDDYLHPMYEGKPRNYQPKKVKIALAATVGVVLVGIIIAVIIAIQPILPKPVVQKPAPKVEEPVTTLTAAQVIEHLRVYYKGTTTARSSLSTAVQTSGNVFYTVVPDTPEVTPTSIAGDVEADLVQENITAMEKSLDYDKFTKHQLQDGIGINNYLADFIRNDVICQIQSYKPNTPSTPTFLEVKCLNMSTYDSYAKAQKPFYEADVSLANSSIPTSFIGKASLEASANAGFTLAEISLGPVSERQPRGTGVLLNQNSRSMYYQGADQVWRFFTTRVQDASTLACQLYENNDNLRLAYTNKPCYNLAQKRAETVQPRKR